MNTNDTHAPASRMKLIMMSTGDCQRILWDVLCCIAPSTNSEGMAVTTDKDLDSMQMSDVVAFISEKLDEYELLGEQSTN